MKRHPQNLILSDVEESSNLMLNESDSTGNTGFAA